MDFGGFWWILGVNGWILRVNGWILRVNGWILGEFGGFWE